MKMVRNISMFILMFFYIYDINCSVWGLPSFITTRRLVVLILFFVWIVKKIHTKKSDFKIYIKEPYIYFYEYVIFFIFILFYSAFLLIINTGIQGETVFLSCFRFIFTSVVAVPLFCNVLKDDKDLVDLLLKVTIFQCIIIILCIFSNQFAHFIDFVFGQDGRFGTPYSHWRSVGYASGIGCTIAKGAQKISIGMMACTYKILSEKNNTKWIMCLLFLTFISTAVARTGLVLGCTCLGVILFSVGRKNTYRMLRIMAILLLCIVIFGGLLFFIVGSDAMIHQFTRLIDLFRDGIYIQYFAGFVGEKAILPSICIDTLIGAGVTSGSTSGGIAVNIDGGYLRMYVGLGLFMAIIFYVLLFYLILKPGVRLNYIYRNVLLCGFFFLLIGEFKEYLIFEGYTLCIYWCFIFMFYRKNELELQERSISDR